MGNPREGCCEIARLICCRRAARDHFPRKRCYLFSCVVRPAENENRRVGHWYRSGIPPTTAPIRSAYKHKKAAPSVKHPNSTAQLGNVNRVCDPVLLDATTTVARSAASVNETFIRGERCNKNCGVKQPRTRSVGPLRVTQHRGQTVWVRARFQLTRTRRMYLRSDLDGCNIRALELHCYCAA